ncbi:MAG: hypothetical protein ACO3JL_04180 [Myxococcota bacterium]
MNSKGHLLRVALFGWAMTSAAGCSSTEVASESSAALAYLGIDRVVSECLALGFAGFNAASSANIPPQQSEGEASGTLAVTGQVDQGASDNKGMRLAVALTGYADGPLDDPSTETTEAFQVVYDTEESSPLALELQLRDIPNGALTGTLLGEVRMEGDLRGALFLDVTFSGDLEEDDSGGTRRVAGTTRVAGSAESDYGTYEVETEL